ncbi:MAG: carbohydrate ABC transporter substrate-binding protein [Eubacterium sp.]|nr:carbohydrate ABC transporter substrate-binding protein [Eubacterium sp.]
MKKKVVSVMLALAMVLSMTACGGKTETSDAGDVKQEAAKEDDKKDDKKEEKEEAKSDVTLSIMASQDWIQDAEMELAEKFTAETGIKIDYQIVPSDQYTNLLTTKLNTGECTDIFAAQSGRFDIKTQFNVEQNAVDLSGESWAGNVDPLAAEELMVDGKLYGQPIQDVSAVWAVAYNKVLFEKLGIAVPTDFASFEAACQKIKDSGVTPIYEAVSDGWHHVLWFPETCVAVETKEPGTADKLNNNEMTFAENATMKTILEQLQDMIDKGYWGENYMSNQYANAAANIASGEYAMTIANQGFGDEVEAIGGELKKDDIGYFVMPLADNQTLNVNPAGPARFVYSGSEHAKEAQQYLAYLASDESLAYLTDNVAKFNKLPYSNAPTAYSGPVKEFYDTYSSKQATVYQTAVKYVNPQWMDIGNYLSAMFLGDIDADEVLTRIDKGRAEQAQAAGDPAWN